MSKVLKKIETVIGTYSGNSWARALISSIPYAGGAIDILITSRHDQIVKKRFEKFIFELKHKIAKLEENQVNLEFLETENAHDILYLSFEKISKIKDKERIEAIAEIIVKSLQKDTIIEFASYDAINILGELSEQEAFILSKAYELYKERPDLLTGSENTLFTLESFLKIIPPKLGNEASILLLRLEGKGLVSSSFEYFKLTSYAHKLVELVNLKYSNIK